MLGTDSGKKNLELKMLGALLAPRWCSFRSSSLTAEKQKKNIQSGQGRRVEGEEKPEEEEREGRTLLLKNLRLPAILSQRVLSKP